MSTKSDKEFNVRVSTTLSVRDVVMIITAIVTIVLGWGVFNTKLTVNDHRVSENTKNIAEQKQEIEKLKEKDVAQDQKILELRFRK